MDPSFQRADSDHPLAPPRPFFLVGDHGSNKTRARRSISSDASIDNTLSRPPPSSFSFPRDTQRTSTNSISSFYDDHQPPSPSGRHHENYAGTSLYTPSIYNNSAAAAAVHGQGIPRTQSQTFRAPFLSPASRAPSSIWSWSPPSQDPFAGTAATGSTTALPLRASASTSNLRPPLPSTLLVRGTGPGSTLDLNGSQTELTTEKAALENPELFKPDPRARLAWWITLMCLFVGAGAAAILCWTGVRDVKARMLDERGLCLVMDEDFSGSDLDDSRWAKEVELGGFGNQEFQMTTTSPSNVYIKDGQLYIMPTLTRDVLPDFDNDGKEYTLDGCTGVVPSVPPPQSTTNETTGGGNTTGHAQGANGKHGANSNRARHLSHAHHLILPRAPVNTSANPCKAQTSDSRGTVINPVQSGRISTKGKVGIKYGRVEVKAKIARGDWLWPAIWMLPENTTYGRWPLSGEIDIMEARGNAPSYPAQGTNYVRSSLNYGLDKDLIPITVPGAPQPQPLTKQIYGWYSLKRTAFDRGFHTYAVEWDEHFLRFYVDSRVNNVLEVGVGKGKAGGKVGDGKAGSGSFWDKGKFPPTAQNNTDGKVEVVNNPWEAGALTAPFDQRFYLIVDLAVGGTSGWFPDKEGGKPWFDESATAMRDFSKAQDTWYPTWPDNAEDRAFRIDSVKMWSKEC